MLPQLLPDVAKGILLRFSRSGIAPAAYFVERQATNGNWSRRIAVNPCYDFELVKVGIPNDQIASIQEQLGELIPGTFFERWV